MEFVSVPVVLLREVVKDKGESFENAKERASAVRQDCNLELILMMKDADKGRLVWEKL